MTMPDDPAPAARSTLPSDAILHSIAQGQRYVLSWNEQGAMAQEILRLRGDVLKAEMVAERSSQAFVEANLDRERRGPVTTAYLVLENEKLRNILDALAAVCKQHGKIATETYVAFVERLGQERNQLRVERNVMQKKRDDALRKHPRIELGPDYRTFRLIDCAGHEVDLTVKSCRIDVEREKWATATLVLTGVEVDAKVREVVIEDPVKEAPKPEPARGGVIPNPGPATTHFRDSFLPLKPDEHGRLGVAIETKSESFAPGDTVWLRSGGPAMTIVKIEGDYAEAAYWVQGAIGIDSLPLAALTKTRPAAAAVGSEP